MADILKAFQVDAIKSKFMVKLDKVYIENRVFRLFSRFTPGCLFLCAGLITLNQLVGKHIECIKPPKEDIREEALNQYCFIAGTYTVPELYNMTVGIDIAHPGVGTFQFDQESDSEQHYHTWYQWVPIALFFQGMTFIMPHILWKAFEGEKIKLYCDLEVKNSLKLKKRHLDDYEAENEKDNDEEKKRKKENKEKRFKEMSNAGRYYVANLSYNNFYAYSYVLCEWLNVAVLIFNFFWINKFLGQNDFLRYGPEVVEFQKLDDTTGLISPQDRVFPKVSKCDFHKYGPSGGLVRYDILCVLAMNIINEKIYVFLWFWFIILFGIGILAILYRLACMFLPGIRNSFIRRRTDPRYIRDLDYCLHNVGYADWFILKKLNDNINSIRFGELCQGIKVEMLKKTPQGRMSPTSPLPAYTESDKSYIKDEEYDDKENGEVEAVFLNNKNNMD